MPKAKRPPRLELLSFRGMRAPRSTKIAPDRHTVIKRDQPAWICCPRLLVVAGQAVLRPFPRAPALSKLCAQPVMVRFLVHDVTTQAYRARKLSEVSDTSDASSDVSEIHLNDLSLMLPDQWTELSANTCGFSPFAGHESRASETPILPRSAVSERHRERPFCHTRSHHVRMSPVIPSLPQPLTKHATGLDGDGGLSSPSSDLPSVESREATVTPYANARLAGLSKRAEGLVEGSGRDLTLDEFLKESS